MVWVIHQKYRWAVLSGLPAGNERIRVSSNPHDQHRHRALRDEASIPAIPSLDSCEPAYQRSPIKDGSQRPNADHPRRLNTPPVAKHVAHLAQCIPLGAKQAAAAALRYERADLREDCHEVKRQVPPQQRGWHVLQERPLEISIAVIDRKRTVDARHC